MVGKCRKLSPTVTSEGFLFFFYDLSKVYGSTKHFFILKDGIELFYVLLGKTNRDKTRTE